MDSCKGVDGSMVGDNTEEECKACTAVVGCMGAGQLGVVGSKVDDKMNPR